MATVPLIDLNVITKAAAALAPTSQEGVLPVLIATRTASLLERDVLAFLSGKYRIQLFAAPFNLFDLRASEVRVALLCASAGSALLAAEAFIIRKQWPLARIIVLGKPPAALADQLYDDSVAQNCSAGRLTAVFHARAIDVWNDRAKLASEWGESLDVPAESDPTKAAPSDLTPIAPPSPRDLPADEWRPLPEPDGHRSTFAHTLNRHGG